MNTSGHTTNDIAERWRIIGRPGVASALDALDTAGARMAHLSVESRRNGRDASIPWTERLAPTLLGLSRALTTDGALFISTERRDSHYVKVAVDRVLGRDRFRNEIVVVDAENDRDEDLGRWRPGHRTLLWYSASAEGYLYNYDAIDRVPYLAPGLVGHEKAARGKTPTDVWWPTDPSLDDAGWRRGVLTRLLRAHTDPDDTVIDCHASSPELALTAQTLGRRCVVIPCDWESCCRIALDLTHVRQTM